MLFAAESSNIWGAFFGGTMLIVEIVVLVLGIVGLWVTLQKADKPGWGAIIPFFNAYLIIKMAGRPGWWLIFYFIPFVNIVVHLIVSLDVSQNFGHGAGWGVLLWIFPWIMFLVLAFGSSQYKQIVGRPQSQPAF